MYLIDSDVLIDFLKNRKEAVCLLGKTKVGEIGTSVICIGEIMEGLAKDKLESFKKMINLFNIYDVDFKTVAKFAEIRKILRKEGNLIDNFDILIAATCLANDLTLITNNLSHFKRVLGLKIYKK